MKKVKLRSAINMYHSLTHPSLIPVTPTIFLASVAKHSFNMDHTDVDQTNDEEEEVLYEDVSIK